MIAKNLRTEAGFTLLELLVVLAAIAFLAVIAVPRIGGALPGAEMEAGLRTLAAGLREARSQAVVQNRLVRFTLRGADGRFYVGAAAGAPLPEALGITLITATGDVAGQATGSIRFFPDGSSSGGRIELTGRAGKRSLTVDWLTGRVKSDG